MFDIGFWELVIIAGIALMVLGPERLPRVATTVGRWVGRARTLARGLQAQMRRELERAEMELDRKAGTSGTEAGESAREDH